MELLEANIKAGYSASNTAHLSAIKTSTNNLEEILEQQVLWADAHCIPLIKPLK